MLPEYAFFDSTILYILYKISVGFRRRGGIISIDLSLLVSLHNNKLHKQTSIQWFKKLKTTNNLLTLQIFFNLQNHPTFHSKERLVNFERVRDCLVGLSILLVYEGPFLVQRCWFCVCLGLGTKNAGSEGCLCWFALYSYPLQSFLQEFIKLDCSRQREGDDLHKTRQNFLQIEIRFKGHFSLVQLTIYFTWS